MEDFIIFGIIIGVIGIIFLAIQCIIYIYAIYARRNNEEYISI